MLTLILSSAAAVAPMLVFLTGSLAIAALADHAGLTERAAAALSVAARGCGLALYLLVWGTCAVLTAALSLDGAVVLMVPVLLALERRGCAPFRALLLGTIGVANASSLAVPQGNPTNLVIARQLGIGPAAFTGRLLGPALVATLVCVVVPAVVERRALAAPCRGFAVRRPVSRLEGIAAAAIAAAAVSAWFAPVLGFPPWLPVAAIAAAGLAAGRTRVPLRLPWRIGLQIGALLTVCAAIGPRWALTDGGLVMIGAVALGTAAAAALLNNLPVSAVVATTLSGPAAYAGLIGLSVGALATRHGSVATMIANDLAPGRGLSGAQHLRLWLLPAVVATALGALLVRF